MGLDGKKAAEEAAKKTQATAKVQMTLDDSDSDESELDIDDDFDPMSMICGEDNNKRQYDASVTQAKFDEKKNSVTSEDGWEKVEKPKHINQHVPEFSSSNFWSSHDLLPAVDLAKFTKSKTTVRK